jgi:hypothetical protein
MTPPAWKVYPRFGINAQGEIFPHVPIPRDYKELLPKFYERLGKEKVDELTRGLRNRTGLDIRLKWHEEHGLTNISTSAPGGFDLDIRDCEFAPHNLDRIQTLAAGAIAMEYVRQLLISKNK